MDQQTYIIAFENISASDASRYSEELRTFLLNVAPNITVQRRRDNPLAQDFGTTLVLVLGTPSIVAAATAIGNWLKLRTSASLIFETPDRKVIANNITSGDAANLAKLLLTQQQE